MRDTTLSQDQGHQLRHAPSAPSIITAAVCAAHRSARSDADEVNLLRLLGLAPDPQRSPTATPTVPRCGTAAAAQLHHRAGEPLCDVCQAWSDERHRLTRTPAGSRCGTSRGAGMHRDLGELLCGPCRAAEQQRVAESKERRREVARA